MSNTVNTILREVNEYPRDLVSDGTFEKVIDSFKSQLKQLLLEKMPKETYEENIRYEGYNDALADITKVIEELFK